MAFVDPTQAGEDDDKQNQSQVDQALNPSSSQQSPQAQGDQAPPSTSAGGGSGVATAGGSPGGGAGAGAVKPSTSGSWTNLNSYLNANSDQATQIGQEIAGSVNDAGNKAQNDVSSLGSNFSDAVNKSTVGQNADAVNKALGDATSLTAGQALNDEDQSAFTQQANANYGGPTDVTAFNGYNQAQQSINDATQKAQATQSEAGRGTLLNDQYQNASQYGYTQGENNLDQLLLENSGGAQAALKPLAQQWSGLSGALNSTVSSGASQAAQAAITDQATATAAKNALATTTQNFEDPINTGFANLQSTDTNAYNQALSAVQNLQNANAPAYNQIANSLQNNGLSGTDYTALGLAPGEHIYGGTGTGGTATGTQLSSYLSQGQVPTLSQFANADQYAQAAALAQLAGQSSSDFLSPAGLSEAGTANGPAFTFDNARAESDNQTNQTQYNQQVQNVLDSVNKGYNFDNISVNGAGVGNDVQGAVDYLNKMIAWNSNGSDMGNTERNWALNQLNQLNEAQSAYGFQPYAVYNGPPVPYGSGLPNWSPKLVSK